MATLEFSAKKLQLLIPNARRHTQKSFKRDNISVRPSNIDDIVEAIYKDITTVAAATGITQSLVSLTDTPSSYSGSTNRIVGINSTDDGAEFKNWLISASNLYPGSSGGSIGKSGNGVGKIYFDSTGNLDYEGDLEILTSGTQKAVFKGTSGYLGIGVTNPLEPIHSERGIVIGNSIQSSGGTIRYNSNDFQGYNGTSWVSFLSNNNLATDNLTQDVENRTYNMSNRELKFYNGVFKIEDAGYQDVFFAEHGGGNISFGGSSGRGGGGSNWVHKNTQVTGAGIGTSTAWSHIDTANNQGLRIANWYTTGGINSYGTIEWTYSSGGLYILNLNDHISIGSGSTINIGYGTGNERPTTVRLRSDAGQFVITGINGGAGSTTFKDETATKAGIEYDADYSGTFSGLSLINKDYADNRYALASSSGVTNIVIGAPTSTTNSIGSSTGTSGTLSGATSAYAGLLTAANFNQIATNVTNIATNTSGLSSLTSTVSSNTTAITTNTTNITSNSTDIATNTSNISTNATNIASNTSLISTLGTNAVHTGDVTGTSGSSALTIASGVVTNAKLADMSTLTFKGREASGTGSPQDLSLSTVRTMLNVENGADVTDTTNVVAALTAGTNVTISPAGVIDATGGSTSPLTLKGDLYTRGASADTRLPVGTNGQALVADSTEATGLKYVNLSETPAVGGGLLVKATASTTTQTFNATQHEVINYEEDYDANGDWDDATHSFTVSATSGSGTYLFSAAAFVSAAGSNRWAWLRANVNGTPDGNGYIGATGDGTYHNISATETTDESWKCPSGSVAINLNVGDVVYLTLYVNAGNHSNSGHESKTTLSVSKLSGIKGEKGDTGTGAPVSLSKTITLEEPVNGDNITIFRTDVAITVQEVYSVLVGSGTAVVHQLYHHTARNSGSANSLTNSKSVTSQVGGNTSVLDDNTIPADSWVWVEFTAPATATTGQYITIDIRYTE